MGCTAFARLHFVQEELRNVLSALLYIASTGCHWRMLPKEFPRWLDGGLVVHGVLIQDRVAQRLF
jgi:hypothetical protein